MISCLASENEDAQVNTFDDSPLTAEGSFRDVRDALLKVGSEFKEIASRLKLILAGKADVVTSNMRLPKRLSGELKHKGITFRVTTHTRDLAISYTGGVNRPNN